MSDDVATDAGAASDRRVGIVVVSHSARIAEGVIELAEQMAPSTRLVAAGGTADGGVGTDFDRVSAALVSADEGAGVVVLCDLGSAVLTADTALDLLDEEHRERVRIADAPIVEGAVAAAVESESGSALDSVLRAAESASGTSSDPTPRADTASGDGGGPLGRTRQGRSESSEPSPGRLSTTTVLVNRAGLHARPAAEFVKLAATFDARVTVNGVDARSLLRIMALGLTEGSEVEITAEGPEASAALTGLVGLVDSGMGETSPS